jgi:hypothetical protein
MSKGNNILSKEIRYKHVILSHLDLATKVTFVII